MVGFACCCAGTVTMPSVTAKGEWTPGGSYRSAVFHGVGRRPETMPTTGDIVISGYVVYTNVAVPQGSTINSATLTLTDVFGTNRGGSGVGCAYAENGATPVPAQQYGKQTRFNIYGEDADDATIYTTAANLDSATRTSASVAVTLDTESGSSAGDQSYPPSTEQTVADITSIVQEIVNRAGWASGNDLQIFYDENGSDSFTGSPSWGCWSDLQSTSNPGPATNAAQLSINYT